jgi:Flp pilus assembly pilin Flp
MKRLWKDESGQDLTEYALLLVLIALASIAALQTFGMAVASAINHVATTLNNQ